LFAFFTLFLSFFYLTQEQNLTTKENKLLKSFFFYAQSEGSTAQPCSYLHLCDDAAGPKDSSHSSNSQVSITK